MLVLCISFKALSQNGTITEAHLSPEQFRECDEYGLGTTPQYWTYTPTTITTKCAWVGIGTHTPLYPLHVTGKALFNYSVILGNPFNPSLPAFLEGYHSLSNRRPWVRFTTAFNGQNKTVFLINKDGGVYCTSLRVRISDDIPVPDFVFRPNYSLMPLNDVKKFVLKNSHLPGIPSEIEIRENGLNIEEMQLKLLQKIEELTLYMIQLNEENEIMKRQLEDLKKNH